MSLAQTIRPVYEQIRVTSPHHVYGTYDPGTLISRKDTYGTFGKLSGAYQNAAEDTLGQMLNAAKGAVNAAGQNNAGANNAISNMNTQADKMIGVANKMGDQANAMNDWASKVGGVAENLTPYADAMKQYGQNVYGQGQTLVNQGNQLLGTWANFAPLVQKYTQSLNALDPNNKVSMAAHDVQSSYQNAQGQNMRAMARMGVDPSSGAFQAQKAQWDQALATALAGAKTRARDQGLNEQIVALNQGLGLGSNLTQAGAQIGSQGVGAMQAAGGLMSGAADILKGQGGLYGTAGQLTQGAGGLMNQQAGVYQGAGALQQAGGQLSIQLGNQAIDANKLLQDAYGSAAAYYNTQAAGYGMLAGANGLIRGMFS